MNWKRMLAYISGSVDEELLLQNEYLATENRILKNQIPFPAAADRIGSSSGPIRTRERLGGLLKFYHREAA